MDGELEQLGERLAELAAHLDAAKHRFLTDLREFDQRGGWHVQGAMSCAHWLAWRVGWDLVTAREHVRVAGKLPDFAAIDDALRRGEVSYSKVRAMLRIATPENEPLLLGHAQLMTASQLENTCRKYALVQRHGQNPHPLHDQHRRYVRRRDTQDGMIKIEAVLHPEEAELVWTMLNQAAMQLARQRDTSASDDSAESHDAGVQEPSVDDSAESHEAMQEQVTPVAAQDDGPGQGALIDDSAESHEAVQEHAAALASSHDAGVQEPSVDDSAESHEAVQEHAAALASSQDAGVQEPSVDDSAESHEAMPTYATAIAPPGDAAVHRTAAMPLDVGAAVRTGVVLRTMSPGTGPTDDPAKSREVLGESVGSHRSLLDRLLEEADALRGAAGAMPGSDRGPSASAPAPQRGSSVLPRQEDAVKRAFSRADALVSLAQGYLRGDRPERSPIEITIMMPAATLHADVVDPVEVGEMGEALLSRDAVRRLSCDAGVVDLIEDEHGAPLSVGRKRRTIAGSLKRALRKRDRTCTFPGCSNSLFLEGHHIKHWADGGETSLLNTALLCSMHHRFVHEYGYIIELGPDQRPRFGDPDGRLVAAAPALPSTPDLGWPRIHSMNEPLAIDANTIACGWDGRQVDYGAVVGHLAVADNLQ